MIRKTDEKVQPVETHAQDGGAGVVESSIAGIAQDCASGGGKG